MENRTRRITAVVIVSAAAAAMLSAITPAEAESIALGDAGLSSASFIHTERDRDDGRVIYDVEFYADGQEYDYEIDAESGKIISMDRDAERYGRPEAGISESDAERIAFADAGVDPQGIEHFRIRRDWDDGFASYKVEFTAGDMEYEYRVSAADGRIIGYSQEAVRRNNDMEGISEEEAVAIALERVKGASADDIRIRRDHDDGRAIYEGTIWHDGFEYEFEIDARSGRIIEWDRDRDDWF